MDSHRLLKHTTCGSSRGGVPCVEQGPAAEMLDAADRLPSQTQTHVLLGDVPLLFCVESGFQRCSRRQCCLMGTMFLSPDVGFPGLDLGSVLVSELGLAAQNFL